MDQINRPAPESRGKDVGGWRFEVGGGRKKGWGWGLLGNVGGL